MIYRSSLNHHAGESTKACFLRVSRWFPDLSFAAKEKVWVPAMNLKGLIHRELGEGLTEEELAFAVGVSVRTIANILADKIPQGPAIWEKFAKYFRMDVDFLRTGGPTRSKMVFELSGTAYHSAAGQIRKVPLLNWRQINHVVTSKDPLVSSMLMR
jgi:transcriptional regulator with XRE-family HTH domain